MNFHKTLLNGLKDWIERQLATLRSWAEKNFDTISASIPGTLPNPNTLTFTGAAEGSYDGSEPLEVSTVGKPGEGTNSEIFNAYAANVATGSCAHAEGGKTTAGGDYSHAEGFATKATGIYSHAEGNATEASGRYAHAEGFSTIASGYYSHAECGDGTTASGKYSHAEGMRATASGICSHAEGEVTTASGADSHAEGLRTTASGYCSHAEGIYTTASSDYQHTQGKYNVSDAAGKYAHIVGNGTSRSKLANAHTIDWNGLGWFAGGLKVGGTGQEDADAKVVPAVSSAAAGQFVAVKAVDESGKPTEWEAKEAASSWNDLTDKPFGEVNEDGYIVPETTFTPSETQIVFTEQYPVPVIGNTYLVNYNGTQYSCIAQDMSEGLGTGAVAVALGNMSAFGGEDTGEPFIIVVFDRQVDGNYGLAYALDAAETVILSIYGLVQAVNKIDEKFLPNAANGVFYARYYDGALTDGITFADVYDAAITGRAVYLMLDTGSDAYIEGILASANNSTIIFLLVSMTSIRIAMLSTDGSITESAYVTGITKVT